MKTEKINSHGNSISSDMFEIGVLVGDILEKIKNKIKNLISKK